MRSPDLDRERSEKSRSSKEFMKSYNKDLPSQFPHVSSALLREFKKAHSALFKDGDIWSLDQHRKKVMDWITSRTNAS